MREVRHGRRSALLVAAAMLMVGVPAPSRAADPPPEGILRCPGSGDVPGSSGRIRQAPFDWTTDIDAGGTVRGHALRLGGRAWRSGPRGFADGPFRERIVTGERDDSGTTLRVVDLEAGCASRWLRFDDLVYGSVVAPDGRMYVSTVAGSDRRELGVWEVSPDGVHRRLVIPPPVGAIARAVPRGLDLALTVDGVRATWCTAEACVTDASDDGLGALAVDAEAVEAASAGLPMSDPRPVPIYDRWGSYQVLDFRSHATDTPPSWMRESLRAAATDATDTTKALSPIFFESDGSSTSGVLRYTATFPDNCATAIACLSSGTSTWTLRMRPHGFDFRWGTLRWCERSGGDGCFDAEHVALHEFGHAIGLGHPEDAGFHLPAHATVMHAVTPDKPEASWNRHAFGACDVASLQEQFGLPTMSTLISTCNDVDTVITLTPSTTEVRDGDQITYRATLRVRSSSAYGALSGIRLNGRYVQLQRRSLGSGADWTTAEMRWAGTPGVYSLTLTASKSYEVRARFGAPGNEGLNGDVSDVVIIRLVG
jgi:hypothetical protein